MLKGHVFKEQIFGNQIFALFINTFLNGKNGVSNNYKNGMAMTYNENTITIQSGAVCIQGRFLEEDTFTSLSAGTETAFCKLVIEIDLDKQNTGSECNQITYKIVKSVSDYPALTQTNIVQNNSGVYQYELARFKVSANGIYDFMDMRTFLDFESIYNAMQIEYRMMLNDLREELEEVEDGSAYFLKNNFAVLTGSITLNANTSEKAANNAVTYSEKILDFPEGFNSDNCVVVSVGRQGVKSFSYGWTNYLDAGTMYCGIEPIAATLYANDSGNIYQNKIRLTVGNLSTNSIETSYKIVLMKV